MKVSKNQKTAAIVAGGGLILYLLYRWYQNNAAAGAASTAGQLTPTPTTGTSTDPGTGGGTGSSAGGTTDWTGGAGGTLDTDLQALMQQDAANQLDLLAAIQGLQPSGSGAGGGTGSGAGAAASQMISGPLNALPVAAQIALVHAGLATPGQLGTKAQQVYAHGDTTLAQYATGQRRAGPRGPTRKPTPKPGLTAAQVRTLGSQLAGYVNASYKPHKAGSAVAPSHHGPKPAVKPAKPPHIDHQSGGVKAPAAQPRVTPPKAAPHHKTTSKRR